MPTPNKPNQTQKPQQTPNKPGATPQKPGATPQKPGMGGKPGTGKK